MNSREYRSHYIHTSELAGLRLPWKADVHEPVGDDGYSKPFASVWGSTEAEAVEIAQGAINARINAGVTP